MSDYYSHKEICEDIRQFESELKDVATRILWKYGNANVDDVVQDVYLEATSIYFNSEVRFDQLKKEVIEMCERISFEYYNKERKNIAKPIGTFNVSEAWTSKGDAFLWEIIEDNSTNALSRLEAIEQIEQIKQYKGKWLTYENAKEYIHGLELRNIDEWKKYANNGKLKNIPSNPDEVYKKLFSWDDWLGIKYYAYSECVNWVSNNLHINDANQWPNITNQLPRLIPVNPDQYYADSGWTDWNTFLGISENKEWEKTYLPYKEAALWVDINLCIHRLTQSTWIKYTNGEMPELPALPNNIPADPHTVYKNTGWISYYMWLGSGRVFAKIFKHTYRTCFEWMKKNAIFIKNKNQYKDFCSGVYSLNKPDWIPDNPDIVYKNIGWHGWDGFLRNDMATKYINDVFNHSSVRIIYKGTKIWVKPISIFKTTVTAITITIFSPVPPNTEIQFNCSDIIGLSCINSTEKTKKILNEKYRVHG